MNELSQINKYLITRLHYYNDLFTNQLIILVELCAFYHI